MLDPDESFALWRAQDYDAFVNFEDWLAHQLFVGTPFTRDLRKQDCADARVLLEAELFGTDGMAPAELWPRCVECGDVLLRMGEVQASVSFDSAKRQMVTSRSGVLLAQRSGEKKYGGMAHAACCQHREKDYDVFTSTLSESSYAWDCKSEA
jgi:hypothetical protein